MEWTAEGVITGCLFFVSALILAGMLFTAGSAQAESSVSSQKTLVFPSELDAVYQRWIIRPGEHLSVFDNLSDLPDCKTRTGANATEAISSIDPVPAEEQDGVSRFVDSNRSREWLKNTDALLRQEQAHACVMLGDRNNPYFTYYSDAFQKAHPEAYMLDAEGKRISVVSNPIRNIESAVPAVDDPTLMGLASELIRRNASGLRGNPFVSAWGIGTEEAYPDYFTLPVGDFRPASRAHYDAYCKQWGLKIPIDTQRILSSIPNMSQAAWYRFREQAIADRAARHMQDFLYADPSRPVCYPTHGNPFGGDKRKTLGQPPSLLAKACDGFEMGHIMIDEDTESLNMLYLSNFTAYGVPVIAPRLGNKTLDTTARGGGRTFTPKMARRLIYECLGMGLWHIGPIHWRSSLGDGEWFIKDTATEPAVKEVFGEIRQAWPVLTGMSRLQPQVGLYISDNTWLSSWEPRWTGFFQDAMDRHWQLTLVGDELVSADLAKRMPVLISIDNPKVSGQARRNLQAYLKAGGTLFTWGDFAQYDEFVRPTPEGFKPSGKAASRWIKMEFPPADLQRTLVNSFQTGEGAWHWEHPYYPVPIENVESAVLKHFSADVLRPIEMDSGMARAHILTLTDGVTLLSVLINRTGENAQVKLKPALDAGNDLQAMDALTNEELAKEGNGYYACSLKPWGTALVWMTPQAPEEETCDCIASAQEAIARWKELGCDVQPFNPFAEALANNAPLPKAYALARRVLASKGLKISCEREETGCFAISAEAFDTNGAPAKDLPLFARQVPGTLEWRPMSNNQKGQYRIKFAQTDMGAYYNADSQKYGPPETAIRFIVSERNPYTAGGAMAVWVRHD